MNHSHPFIDRITDRISTHNHYICLGLDPDPAKVPSHFTKDIHGIRSFLFEVIEATKDHVICYKPNISFFEALGIEGLHLLIDVRQQIPPTIPVIIDAKRGDIGNTSAMQASFLFDTLRADATTLHPYMGYDSLAPFFNYTDRFHFVLGLTSNPGAELFEKQPMANGQMMYHHVISHCSKWHQHHGNIGVVVGATNTEIEHVRAIDPQLLFLVPGVGAQGGNYQDIAKIGKNLDDLLLINVSRSLLYLDNKTTYRHAFLDSLSNIISTNLAGTAD